MRHFRKPIAVFSVAALLLLVTACSGTTVPESDAPQVHAIDYGVIALTDSSWPDIVAQRTGIWDENGVELNTVTIGVSEGVAAVASGSLDVFMAPCNTAISSYEAGATNVKTFLINYGNHPGVLIGTEGVESYEDLTGGTVGTASIASGSTILLIQLLEDNGLAPDDYQLVAGGGTAQMYTGLLEGVYDAAYQTPPQSLAAQEEGLVVLGKFSEVSPKYQFACMAANTDWLEEETEAAVAMAKGWLEGVEWLHNPDNRELAEQYLADAIELEPSIAAATYEEVIIDSPGSFPLDGRVDPAALDSTLEVMMGVGEIETMPEDPLIYFDMSIIDQIESA